MAPRTREPRGPSGFQGSFLRPWAPFQGPFFCSFVLGRSRAQNRAYFFAVAHCCAVAKFSFAAVGLKGSQLSLGTNFAEASVADSWTRSISGRFVDTKHLWPIQGPKAPEFMGLRPYGPKLMGPSPFWPRLVGLGPYCQGRYEPRP